METYGRGLSQVGRPCSHYQTIYSTSCTGHKSTEVQSISHNMPGSLQSHPHIVINDEKWLQLQLCQLHFDRSLLTHAVCLLSQVITAGSLSQSQLLRSALRMYPFSDWKAGPVIEFYLGYRLMYQADDALFQDPGFTVKAVWMHKDRHMDTSAPYVN